MQIIHTPESILKQIHDIDQYTPYTVIIANGLFPSDNYLLEQIKNATILICCDGAIENLITHKINPTYIIGDCDSITANSLAQFSNKIIKINDQNTNDLTKAINFARSLHLSNIIILGATGLREDHTIANIALLADYSKMIKQIALISDYGIFTAHENTVKVNAIPGQQISFFCPNPNTQINCAELKWPLINHIFPSWFNGTLNQATANYMTISTSDSVIVYRAFEVK